MKSRIKVVGAAIVRDGKILALRRSAGIEEVVHKFEFVGGKVEEGETPQEALRRECREELSLDIEVGELLNTIDYDYPKTSVTLSVYFAKPLSGYELKEHCEERWIDCAELDASEWAPADKPFVNSLKTGCFKSHTAHTEEEYGLITAMANEIMHETFDTTLPQGQVDYMVDSFLTPQAIGENIGKNGYVYKIIYFNGEAAGFYAFCPAKNYDPAFTEGAFLSKLYIKKFARGKRIASKIIPNLPRPLYLTVKRDNEKAINIYKHYGFKIRQSISADIGGGFTMEDFLMVLGK